MITLQGCFNSIDYNLPTDILLGLVLIVGLGFLYEKTFYMTFSWYMIVAIIPIIIVFQISSFTADKVESKPKLENIPQVKTDDALSLFASLLFWLIPIIIEAGFGGLLVCIKYQISGKISLDDVYLICEIIPICLLLIPCFFVNLREMLPNYTKTYIYDSMNILGIAANILVLVFGGWLTVTAINT